MDFRELIFCLDGIFDLVQGFQFWLWKVLCRFISTPTSRFVFFLSFILIGVLRQGSPMPV